MTFVEATERDGGKVHGPKAVVDFFEADVFAAQGPTEKPHLATPRDLPDRRDAADLEMARIDQGRQARREGSRRGLIAARRRLILQRLVRPLVIVFGTEAREASL